MLCFARVGGMVQWLLEAPIFGYTSKLTFTIYLIHPTILYVWVRGITGPIHYSAINYGLNFLGVLTSSAALAFVIHMAVELPTSNLISIMMSAKQRDPKPPSQGDAEAEEQEE